MIDRELLELAAKAAGLPVEFDEDGMDMSVNGWYPCGRLANGDVDKWWNPLTDDGDALRLAVKLNLCPQQYLGAVYVSHTGEWAVEPLGDDPYAATRRAIVRAAAEIGKGKP